MFCWPNTSAALGRVRVAPVAIGFALVFFTSTKRDNVMRTSDWKEFLAKLKSGDVMAGTPGDVDWTRHVYEISVPRQIMSLNEDDWTYWLEFLPPRWMSGSHFCFAEGEESFRFFWATKEGQFFARQLDVEETLEFCALSGTPAPAIKPPPRFVSSEEEHLIKQHLHPSLTECCGEGGA